MSELEKKEFMEMLVKELVPRLCEELAKHMKKPEEQRKDNYSELVSEAMK